MMRNKKGIVMIAVLLIGGLLLVLITFGLGLIFFNKIVDALGSKTLIFLAVFVLLVIFRNVVSMILSAVWAWFMAIIKFVLPA